MSAITQISGTQASYANLASQTGVAYAATSDVPPGSAATGVLRSLENVAATLRVDANASICPSNGDQYWLRFWIRALRGVGAAPTSKNDYGLFVWDGTRFLTLKFQTNSVGDLGWTPVRGDVSIAGGTADAVMFEAAAPEPVIGWGDWCEIVLHAERHGSTGKWRLFVNGVLYAYKVSINTDQLWTTGLNANSFLVQLPQWVGAYWEVCGPIESYNGSDITITPQQGLVPITALATKLFLPFATAQAGALTQGCYGQVSGTGTVTVDSEYANSSTSPGRHRLIFAGDGLVPVWTTIPKVGALPFNEQGWGHLVLSDLLVPTTSSSKGLATWQINDDAGSALLKFQINNGALYAAAAAGQYINIGAWTHATARYALLVHLNRDGRAALSVIDLTTSPDGASTNATITTSRRLADWTPQLIGTLSLSAIPNGANNIEAGFMGVFARPTLFALDSISSGPYAPGSGNTTALNNPAGLARSFPMQRECQCLPGAYWPLKNVGLERRVLVASLGRSGLKRRDWGRNVLAPLQHMAGCEVLVPDGGSINDITQIGTLDDAGLLASLQGGLDEFLRWAVARDNAVWISTMLRRDIKSLSIAGISAANPAVITLSAAHGLPTGSAYRVYIDGVVGNAAMQNAVNTKAFANCSATVGGSTITLPTIANNGPDTSAGTYTSGGTVVTITPQEVAAIAAFNAYLLARVAFWQKNGLLTVSDIAGDQAANPATYPNNSTFWQDFIHFSTGVAAANGGQFVAERKTLLRAKPPANATRRRWPLRLLGR